MKAILWRSILVLVAVLPSGDLAGQAAPPPSAVEQDVIDAERAWTEASRTGHVDALDRILADEFVYTFPSGYRLTKQESLDQHALARYVLSDHVDEGMEVRVYGDVAVVLGTHREKSTFDGQDISGRYRWTEVFVKRDGRWQVVAGQLTKLPEEP